MINVRTSVQTVMIGNSVEFECQAVGDPEPTVKWSKVGSLLPEHIVVKGGMLRIERITEADAGQYRCTATNDVGSVQSQVLLKVQCECKNLFTSFWLHTRISIVLTEICLQFMQLPYFYIYISCFF